MMEKRKGSCLSVLERLKQLNTEKISQEEVGKGPEKGEEDEDGRKMRGEG